MRLNRSVEHGVVVLLMLALSQDHRSVKSSVLAETMGVSDSYLKKTLRRLVRAGLVRSAASKAGGYTLARPISAITLGDAYRALDEQGVAFRSSPLAEAVFPDDPAHVQDAETRVGAAFEQAHEAFLRALDAHPLSEYLAEGAWEQGIVRWGA